MTLADHERRKKLRVDFKTNIIVKINQSEIYIEGSSKDLSLKGLFVHTNEDIALNTKCQVEVHLTGMTEQFALYIQGTVLRKEPKGIAIEFDSMDLDSYTHLKNVVRYNSENPDDVH